MTVAAPARAEVRARTLTDRFLAAVPLLSIFFWICVLYVWEAWRHGSPWLFGDELQMTQLSRAIAETGHVLCPTYREAAYASEPDMEEEECSRCIAHGDRSWCYRRQGE